MTSTLLIAYHFPPIVGSSGVHRTLQFARYLPEWGWEPVVLTVHPRAYPRASVSVLDQVPPRLHVLRAQAWDTARHFSWRGRYLEAMAVPDRWASWWIPGVVKGLKLIRRHRPAVLWSTFPVATAHLIGVTLQRLTGVPWVADFRDPMVQPGLPRSPVAQRSWRWIEAQAVRQAARCCVTTPSTLEDMRSRYPQAPESRWVLIENGFDEGLFESVRDGQSGERSLPGGRPLTLLHSGILYAEGRNPIPFLKAFRVFRDEAPGHVQVVFRAAGGEIDFASVLEDLGLRDAVRVLPAMGYREAVREMVEADGLLLFQGARFNRQIPAKAYEYIRAGRPVVALIDPEGDTMRMLRGWSYVYPARIDSEEKILAALRRWFEDLVTGQRPVRPSSEVNRLSRRARTEQLAAVFDDVTRGPGSRMQRPTGHRLHCY